MKKVLILVLIVLATGAYWYIGLLSGTQNGEVDITIKGPIGVAQGADGEYLTDKNGLTLYFNIEDEDSYGQISQSCDAECEKMWLPLLLGESEVAITSDSDPLLSRLNLFTRTDGKKQYAIGTTPLYRYFNDLKAGEMNGFSIKNWQVAKP